MRVATLISAVFAAALVAAEQRTAHIYIQPVQGSTPEPQLLAEVAYDPAAVSSSQVVSYEAPELSETASLVRIGLYDSDSKQWVAGTTVASVDNFGKGYAPNIILSVDEKGDVHSAAYKGVQIDAGQTRDFGPKVVLLPVYKGKQPELNKPVVLSPEGKKVGEEPEKTLLQKYWWVLAVMVVMSMAGGGEGK